MTDPIATWPAWARTLAHAIRARLGNTFLLHGNTHDLVPAPAPIEGGAGPVRFVPLSEFLAGQVFGTR